MTESRSTRITSILQQWEERRASGSFFSIAELCDGQPELLPEIRRQIAERLAGESDFDSEPPGIPNAIGPYRVLRQLMRVAMATVYLCETHAGAPGYAVSVVDTRNRRTRRRFEREAPLLAGFAHPGIARVHDFGRTHSQLPYLATEYVEGVPLREFVATKSAVDSQASPTSRAVGDPACVIGMLRQILDAISYAHSHGVIHHDLSPTSVLVTSDEKTKILDYGVARFGGVTNDALMSRIDLDIALEQLPYLAPEQIDEREVDFRADLYSIGAIGYELLSGKRPFDFQGVPYHKAIVAVETEKPQRLRRLAPHVSKPLEAVIHKALEKDRAHRYRSALEFIVDLERCSANEPLLAASSSLHFTKVIADHATKIVTGLLLFCVLGLVASMLLNQSGRSRVADRGLPAEHQREQRLQAAGPNLTDDLFEEARREEYATVLRAAYEAAPSDIEMSRQLLLDASKLSRHTSDMACAFLERMLDRTQKYYNVSAVPHCATYSSTLGSFVGYRTGRVIRIDAGLLLEYAPPSRSAILAIHVDEKQKVLYAGTRDGDLWSWDLDDSTQPLHWERDSAVAAIRGIGITPDGRPMSIDQAGETVVWDPETRAPALTRAFGKPAQACAYDPTKQLIAMGDRATPMKLFHFESRVSLLLRDHPGGNLRAVAFGDNGRLLIESNDKHGLLVWNTETRELLGRIPLMLAPAQLATSATTDQFFFYSRGERLFYSDRDKLPAYRGLRLEQPEIARALAALPAGDRLVLAMVNGTICELNLDPAKPDMEMTIQEQLPLASTPSMNGHVVVVDEDGNPALRAFNRASTSSDSPVIDGPLAVADESRVVYVEPAKGPLVVETGDTIVTQPLLVRGSVIVGLRDRTLLRVDFKTGEIEKAVELGSRPVACHSVDGRALIVLLTKGELLQFDPISLELTTTYPRLFSRARATHVVGPKFFAARRNGEITVFDWTTGEHTELASEFRGVPSAFGYSPDGQSLLVGTTAGDLVWLDAETGSLKFDVERILPAEIVRIFFAKGGEYMFVADALGNVARWSIPTG